MRAANKAFLVTRVGDTAMALGLFLLATHLRTLGHPGTDAAGDRAVAGRQRYRGCRSRAVAGRRCRQISAASAADLAARCDGRPYANQRTHPRGDHGDGRRLPDCADKCLVYPGATCCSSLSP